MGTPQSSNARLAAVFALVVAFIVLLVIVVSSFGGDGSGEGAPSSNARERSAKQGPGQPQRKVYVVKPGDTLIVIAHKVGIPVERLQRLNPNIDQFSLQSGDRVKLR